MRRSAPGFETIRAALAVLIREIRAQAGR